MNQIGVRDCSALFKNYKTFTLDNNPSRILKTCVAVSFQGQGYHAATSTKLWGTPKNVTPLKADWSRSEHWNESAENFYNFNPLSQDQMFPIQSWGTRTGVRPTPLPPNFRALVNGLLYILTSVWVQRIPNAGNKFGVKLSKKTVFWVCTQTLVKCFIPQKNIFSVIKPLFNYEKLWIIMTLGQTLVKIFSF